MNNAEMVMYLNDPETFMLDRVAILDAHVAAAVAQARREDVIRLCPMCDRTNLKGLYTRTGPAQLRHGLWVHPYHHDDGTMSHYEHCRANAIHARLAAEASKAKE